MFFDSFYHTLFFWIKKKNILNPGITPDEFEVFLKQLNN